MIADESTGRIRAEDHARAFGARLARERERQRLSMSDLARIAGMHASEVSRLERGLRDPRLSTIVRLARALDVDVSELLEGIASGHGRDPVATIAARFGETLRGERRALGLTQDDLALAAGLGLRAVHDVEAGKKTAHLETWLNAAEALGLEFVLRRRHSGWRREGEPVFDDR